MFDILLAEAKKIVRNPKRLGEAFRIRRWRQFFSVLRFNSPSRRQWKTLDGTPGLKQREYPSYADYVRHQQSKFPHLDLAEYDRAYRGQLRERLRGHPFIRPGASVLCLAARQGTEVKAFLDLGCFAVGLDLNPGPDNPLVLPGDFHNAPFPSASVDVVFTNSFDHSFDPPKLIREIIRLLKPGGVLVIEAIQGEAHACTPDYYASFWWTKIDDLLALLDLHGFVPTHRASFTQPWPGEHICLSLKSVPATSA
jgi:SAM-dependent methyltransferase